MAVKRQIDLDERLDPWARQPQEKPPSGKRTTDYYVWFSAYLSQGKGRSVSDLANEEGRSVAYMQRIAWAYRWKERAAAWDLAESDRRAEQRREERDQADQRRSRLGRAFAMRAGAHLARDDHASQRLACRLAETAIRCDLSVYGTPDKNTHAAAVAPEGAPVEALLAAVPASEEVRMAELRAVLARIAGGDPQALADLDPADFDMADDQ